MLKCRKIDNFSKMQKRSGFARALKNGADVNAKDNNRQETTLHEMAHQGKLEIAKILLESGASLILKDKKGNKAIELKSSKLFQHFKIDKDIYEILSHVASLTDLNKPL